MHTDIEVGQVDEWEVREEDRQRDVRGWDQVDPKMGERSLLFKGGKVSACIELLRYFSISKIPPDPDLF